MADIVGLTIKVPEHVRDKLKMIALSEHTTVTKLVVDWVDTLQMNMPVYATSSNKPVIKKSGKVVVYKSGKVDEDKKAEIIKRIMSMDADGVKGFTIAKTFNEEGIPTFRGGVQWRDSTIKGIIKREKTNKGLSEASE